MLFHAPYLFHSLFFYKPGGQKWMDGDGQLPGMEGCFSRAKIFSGKEAIHQSYNKALTGWPKH